MSDKAPTVKDLMAKGEGVLTKRGGVWTYPGCANDSSGTNLVLPLEYVSDAEVQKALSDGDLRAAVMSPAGVVSAVRLIDDEVMTVTAGLAGTPEMGTELPKGSRVEHDAGSRAVDPAKVEQQTIDAINNVMRPAAEPAKPAESAKPRR